MSHIFEALQKSEAERSRNRQAPSLPAELLRAAEQEAEPPVPEPREIEADFEHFPSLKVTPLPNSKLLSLTDTESLAAEKFRFFGVRLRQLQQLRAFKRVLITSTIPEEGKSMICANLGVILARKKKQRVLILEGDLRRPVLPVRFGLGKVEGLSEWMQQESQPLPNIYRLEGLNLWLLPAGRAPENPLEMMQSSRLAGLMDQLSNWFDWILIDSPPILPLADTSVWMKMADGIVLVTREGVTEKRELKRGLEILEPSKLLGVVLNSSTETDHSNYYQRYTSQPGSKPRQANSLIE
ncbi:MAG: CpsD/CapB family tyrosine-protein kinase [Terriglobales bacterium]